MKNNFLVFIFLGPYLAFSQTSISGVLIDSLTKSPIEFANIGIPGKAVGTVSNEKGEYTLLVPDSLMKEQVKASMIGYRGRTVPVAALLKTNKLLLSPQHQTFKEVTVSAKKYKTKILGHETTTKLVSAGFRRNSLGAEIAVPLNIKHTSTQLKKFMLNINSNSLGVAPIFRLNIYTYDKEGLPGQNILAQNIVITPSATAGLVEFDLRPYSIFVDEDVFVSIEWIKDLGDAAGLSFSSKLVGNTTCFRQTSQDKWEKTNVVGVGIHVEVGY